MISLTAISEPLALQGEMSKYLKATLTVERIKKRGGGEEGDLLKHCDSKNLQWWKFFQHYLDYEFCQPALVLLQGSHVTGVTVMPLTAYFFVMMLRTALA